MREPLTKISPKEMLAIKNHIKNNIDMDIVGEPEVNTEYLLREWNAQKQFLFNEVFKEELILSQQVVFTKNAEQIREEMDHNWDDLTSAGKDFWRAYSEFFRTKRRNLYLKYTNNFPSVEFDEEEELYFLCEDLLSCEVLAANSVSKDFTIDLPKPDGTVRPYHVQKGSRPIRVLNRLQKAFDIQPAEGLNDIAVWQSRYLNDKRLAGKFCLSIHPLDYMTMSENNCGWTSCMNWPESGCYRSGTIEMMNSPMVIVAYLESSRDPLYKRTGWDMERQKFEYLEWNSKKWRILICVNEKGIFSVKGYPYQHEEMTKFAMSWIASLFENRKFDETKEFKAFTGFFLEGGNSGAFLNINPRTYRMYNDFGCCRHYMKLDSEYRASLREGTNYLDFMYSGASECMCCGSLVYPDKSNSDSIYFYSEENLVCDNCNSSSNNSVCCDCCGERMSEDDVIWVGDVPVCQSCFEDNCFEDAWTYDLAFNEDAVEFSIIDKNTGKVYEIGRCVADNVRWWINVDFRSKFFDDYDRPLTRTIEVAEELLSDSGHRRFDRERQIRTTVPPNDIDDFSATISLRF